MSAPDSPIRILTLATQETHALAARIAALSAPVDCIALRGDLGAGKTEFSRAFIQSLCGASIEVTSPTFTLVQDYDAGDHKLWHFDLYRLEDENELDELGLSDMLQSGRVLIEWPDLADDRLPENRLDISISFEDDEITRCFTLHPHGVWKDKVKHFG